MTTALLDTATGREPLDPDLASFFAEANHILGPSGVELEERRHRYERLAEIAGPPGTRGVIHNDLTIGGENGQLVEIRRYTMPERDRRDVVAVYLHGGGWNSGSLASHHGLCALISERSGTPVLAVNYRLSPEHPYPAALEDVLLVLRWAAASGSRVLLAGDSAGAYLAAASALLTRKSMRLAWLGLLYPALSPKADLPSHSEHAQSVGLKREVLLKCWHWFVGEQADEHGLDLLEVDDWQGLPATSIVSAQWDPLRDEANALAERLRRDGIPVRYRCAPGMPHGFARFTERSARARTTVLEFCDELRCAAETAP